MQHNIQKHNRCHKIDIHQIINKFVQFKFPPVRKMFGPKMFGSKMLGPKNTRVQKWAGPKIFGFKKYSNSQKCSKNQKCS